MVTRNPDGTFKKGFKHSEKWKKLLSEKMKGKNNPNFGKKLSQEHKDAISKAHIGTKHSDEHIQKLRDNNAKYWTGREFTDQHKLHLSNARMHQRQPRKDSKPEKMMQLAFQLNDINFETHKAIRGQPDIFIEPNVCIFVDGDYWHGNPKLYSPDKVIKNGLTVKDIWKKDMIVNSELIKSGYFVVRLWESDIKSNSQGLAQNIISLIDSVKPVIKLGEKI